MSDEIMPHMHVYDASHAETALIRKGAVKINLQIIEGNESVSAFYSSLGFRIEKRVSMGKRLII